MVGFSYSLDLFFLFVLIKAVRAAAQGPPEVPHTVSLSVSINKQATLGTNHCSFLGMMGL